MAKLAFFRQCKSTLLDILHHNSLQLQKKTLIYNEMNTMSNAKTTIS
jgi:hypothetical protein